ncbi:MAG: TonB-dependent receptor [Bryobacterales bacterium]|nr:TonB-dependent receptor [Bryobacterales bacterium]
MKRLSFAFACFLLLLASSNLWAQQSTGSMAGTVTDPNGAAVPDAKVVALHVPTGQQFTSNTTYAGLYVFGSLPVGPYTVSVEKTGFKKLSRSGIEIRIAQRQELALTLELGDVMQTVEVTAEAPLLETTSAMRGQNVSVKFLNNLPFFSGGIRNPRSFVTYMPGVNNVAGEITIAGAGARGQEILIDGASATIPESGGTSFNFPAAEMFGEFKLLTGTFDAEYGRFGGGVEIYVTKSGTNDLHGTLFHNMRRDIWNANAWANNARGLARPKDRFNEYGAGVGGPIWIPKVYDGRNKSFFFFTYSRDKRPISTGAALSTVPTALMRQGNFSQVPQAIYDPATTAGNVRTPFPGNIIPRNRFSTISANMVGAVPDPTRSALISNFDFINTTIFDREIYNLKFDHSITPNNRISFTVTKEDNPSDILQALPGALSQNLKTSQRPDNWRWNHDYVIKPTMLLHTTFGYSRTRQLWDNPYQKGFASKFGFPGITGDSDATPRVIFNGPEGLTPWGVQDGKVGNGSQINITYHLNSAVSIVRGKHEFKIGGDVRRLHTTSNPIDLAGTNGRYQFARSQTALPTNLSGTGHVFASFLLGLPDQADRVATPVIIGNIRYGYHAGFFQDTWKVNSRLTLSLGFRYEVPIGWHDVDGNYSAMNRNLPNAAAGGLPGAYEFYGKGTGRTGQKRPYRTDFTEVGPRLGFSYRLFEKTVFRGGYGIYYQTLGGAGCGCRIGFSNPITLVSDGLNGALNWDSGIAAPPSFRPPPLIDPAVGNFNSVDVFSDNYGFAPRIHTWSATIQHEIGKYLIDISYQGNRGRRLNSTLLLNQLPTSRLALGSLLQQRIDSPAAAAAGFTKPFPSFPNNQTVAQSLRPFPQYFDVSEYNAGIGRSWYDSLQTKVERRFGDWQMMAGYTFSKTLGIGHFRQVFNQAFGTSGYNVAAQDNYNYNEMKSYQPFDLPHVFNLLLAYDLPMGKGKKFMNSSNFLSNLLFGGWNVSGIARYQAGPLLLVQAPANTLGTGVLFTFFKKANVGTGPIQTGIDRGTLDPNNPNTRWLNPAAFAVPGQYELGNAAQYYGDMRNPPVLDERLAIQKRMRFPVNADRSVDLIYRVDAFNMFNRTAFGGIVNVVGNANFGRPTGPQVGARLITMGLRLDF